MDVCEVVCLNSLSVIEVFVIWRFSGSLRMSTIYTYQPTHFVNMHVTYQNISITVN